MTEMQSFICDDLCGIAAPAAAMSNDLNASGRDQLVAVRTFRFVNGGATLAVGDEGGPNNKGLVQGVR